MVISPQAPHGKPLPYMMCRDPESGTDHSLKEISVCLIWHRVDTALGIQGSCHKDVYAIFDLLFKKLILLFTTDKHVCLKDSSAELVLD